MKTKKVTITFVVGDYYHGEYAGENRRITLSLRVNEEQYELLQGINEEQGLMHIEGGKP
jgi:hypothetical protein